MNIVYISNKKSWGGITSWMQKTALDLEKRGHNVWIVSHKKSYFTRHASDEINIIPKNLGMDFNPIMIIWLLLFIKKNSIDVIITNITKEVLIGGIAAKITKIPNIRRIGTEKDFDNPNIKRFYKLIDFTIAPCKYMVVKILENKDFVELNQITHIYNGCNIKKLSASKKKEIKKNYNIPINRTIIGITCQFSETKNIIGVLNVFHKLKRNYKNLYLVLAGDGPEKNTILEKIEQLGLSNYIKITGFVNNTLNLAAVYDIGVLFSYLEGFSNSIVEYMSVGTPVICTDVGGQYEIVNNDYNGYLIEPGNEKQLYDKLSLLIDNKKLRKEFSRNSFKTIESKFSKNKMIDEFEKILRKYVD